MSDEGEAPTSETLERTASAGDGSGPRQAGDVPADLAGRTLLHFRVVERLGEGGMGVVYRAIDEKLRRPVALKVLATRYVVDERNKEMIFREARSAAGLTHANICAIYEVHDLPEIAFYVMELVAGETLSARIARSRRLPVDEALRLGGQIARALARAHEAGVVHRDLKADNVMITESGDVKLLDFGLAKLLDVAEPSLEENEGGRHTAPGAFAPTMHATAQGTERGRVMGTPAYMAPEQARGETVDARADVFAFGVVLYEMLTGLRPFLRARAEPWLWGDARSPDWRVQVPLRQANPGVPRAVERVVERCLAMDPAERFADGAALGGAIDEHTRRAARGGRSRIAGVAVVAGVALAIGGIEWRAGRERARAAATSAPVVELSPDAPLPFAKLQPSATPDPVAREDFRSAMEAMARGQVVDARTKLDDALTRDPSFASARVQRAFIELESASPALDSMRRDLASALNLRWSLPPRDAELLDAIGPAAADPQDWTEAARRLDAMTARRSGDAEAWEGLGTALAKAARYSDAIRAFEREAAVDPLSIGGMDLQIQIELALDDREAARASVDECVRRAPASVECKAIAATLLGASGDCESMDRAARELTVLAPDLPTGYALRADAQAGLRAPVEVIDELLGQRRARAPGARQLTLDQLSLATWRGDLGGALALARRLQRIDDGSALVEGRVDEVMLLQELGRTVDAGEAAIDLLRRTAALPRRDSVQRDWGTPMMLAAAHRGGTLSEADFRRKRDAWIDSWKELLGKDAWAAEGPYAWAAAFAYAAVTESGAREAVDHLADFGVLPKPGSTRFGDWDLQVGEAFRLAGKLDDALPRLEAASRRCTVVAWPPADLGLGLLHEARGDTAAACASFGRVLALWGRATPRSVTAASARTHAQRLGCGQ